MSCVRLPATFRLLNHLVGWDPDVVESITGLDQDSGIQLGYLGQAGDLVPRDDISRWLPPANLAPGCGPCEWYLVTPCPPASRLLRRDSCQPCFTEPNPGAIGVLQGAVAVAVAGRQVAVADPGRNTVLLFVDGGRRRLNSIPFDTPGPLTYAPWQEWLVVDQAAGLLVRLDLAGFARGRHPAGLPGNVNRLAVDDQCRIWLAVDAQPIEGRPQVSLWVAERTGSRFEPATLDQLQRAFPANAISFTSTGGFCLADELDCGPCFSWYGRTLSASLSKPPATAQYATQGQLLSLAIDSGIPRCRWHRVRLEGSVPSSTSLSFSVSTSEVPTPQAQGIADGDWSAFAPGRPHPADWQTGTGSPDFLIRQPPGRYLFVRIRMTGDGVQTPRLQRVRLDFPRQTSLDQLPLVYRDTPQAEDFGERFLALFDAFLADVDEQIERLPALLDVPGVPDSVLPWLGSFLDIAMDPAWDTARRRRLLQAAPKLYRMRGTVDGMRAAIRLLFDVDPVIREHADERPWGSLGSVSLSGGVRLFSPSSWRFRLDRSRLGQAPLRSFGQADLDPFSAVAYRFDVIVPLSLDPPTRQRLQQLIDAQKPAHTLARLFDGSGRFALGASVRVGIDTVFKHFEPSVLSNEGCVQLGRYTVLSPLKQDSTLNGMTVGRSANLGTQ
ncbi:MAG: phage tail protein [Gammaproteobacteria bacterium]